ncbi:MAG: acetyl-CoA carboxylase biotin carboxyl carrier protein [bacterium]|nr:acetyl-CoA carboxylase biotin carboxyl carrier protein [bacterium]
MQLNELKKLIKMLEESNVEEIEIKGFLGRTVRVTKKRADTKVVQGRVEKEVKVPEAPQISAVIPEPLEKVETPNESVMNSAAQPAPQPPKTAEPQKNFVSINAPIIGTFYRASSPGAKPYIEVGDRVTTGKVVCILEAMKVMNEIEAEVSGVVREILVENGKPVEYGQPLFMLEC